MDDEQTIWINYVQVEYKEMIIGNVLLFLDLT